MTTQLLWAKKGKDPFRQSFKKKGSWLEKKRTPHSLIDLEIFDDVYCIVRMIALTPEDIFCIVTLVGSLFFAIFNRSFVLFISSLVLVGLTQRELGRMDESIHILPVFDVGEPLQYPYQIFNHGKEILLNDLQEVLTIQRYILASKISIGFKHNHAYVSYVSLPQTKVKYQ